MHAESSKAGSTSAIRCPTVAESGPIGTHTGAVEPSAPGPHRPWLDELDLKAGPPGSRWASAPSISTTGWWSTTATTTSSTSRRRCCPSDPTTSSRPVRRPRRQRRGARAGDRLARRPPPRSGPPEPVADPGSGSATGSGASGGLHPLDAAGRMVQEDLCVLVERRRPLSCSRRRRCASRRTGACTRSWAGRWRRSTRRSPTTPRSSRPRSTASSTGSASIARSCGATSPSTATTTSTGPSPTSRPSRSPPMPSGVDQVWLRSERQTLVRLPRTGAVLFTIKTQLCPVTALRERPDLAVALADEAGRRAGRPRRPGRHHPLPALAHPLARGAESTSRPPLL